MRRRERNWQVAQAYSTLRSMLGTALQPAADGAPTEWRIAQREFMAVVVIALVGGMLLINALFQARVEVRDDLRKADIAHLRTALEQYNNKYDHYVTPPEATIGCTESQPESWFFGDDSPLLKEQFIDAIPHDLKERRGRRYYYCVTAVDNGVTTGYYLQAQLEKVQAPEVGFDEEEMRKYYYRILQENDQMYYRVCGGKEKQCQPAGG